MSQAMRQGGARTNLQQGKLYVHPQLLAPSVIT